MIPRRFSYFPALDGVRGVALLMVLACHSLDPFFPAQGGSLGVNMFFVLSGFLITGLLLSELDSTGSVWLGGFYLRRALRLMPPFILTLALVAALPNVLPGSLGLSAILPAAFFYVGNYVQAFSGHGSLGYLAHTWSLSVEEQFYLVWPIALTWLAATGRLRRWLPGLILAFAASRAVLGLTGMPDVAAWLPSNADQLLIGALLAVVFLQQGAGWAASQRIGWATREGTQGPLAIYGGLTIAGLASAALIAHLVTATRGPLVWLFTLTPVIWLGRVSYGVYLFHYPIFKWTQAHDWPSSFKTVAVEYALTAVPVLLSWFLVERSALRLKDRIHGRRASAPRLIQVATPETATT